MSEMLPVTCVQLGQYLTYHARIKVAIVMVTLLASDFGNVIRAKGLTQCQCCRLGWDQRETSGHHRLLTMTLDAAQGVRHWGMAHLG